MLHNKNLNISGAITRPEKVPLEYIWIEKEDPWERRTDVNPTYRRRSKVHKSCQTPGSPGKLNKGVQTMQTGRFETKPFN